MSAQQRSNSKKHKKMQSNGGTNAGGDTGVDVGATTSKASPAAASAETAPALKPLFNLILVPTLSGCAFGAVFQLSRVHEFSFIRNQMLFRQFLMLKMFLSAASVSLLVLTLLPYVSGRGHERINKWRKVMTSMIAERRGVPSLVVGAATLGVGMAVCGSCPGTVFAQVASGSIQARWILLGAGLASCVYPLVDMLPGFAGLLAAGRVRSIQTKTLPQLLSFSTEGVALSLVAVFVTIVGVCELFSPWQAELQTLVGDHSTEAAWPRAIPPWVAGMVVGSLQLPLILLTNNHLGCSSSYMTVVARALQVVSPATVARIPLLAGLVDNYWQCFLMLGVSLGAYVSSTVTGGVFHSDAMLSPVQSVVGGALLVIGARVAAGCTSGHGISGMGYMALNSFIAVAAMFGGGILTAMIFFS